MIITIKNKKFRNLEIKFRNLEISAKYNIYFSIFNNIIIRFEENTYLFIYILRIVILADKCYRLGL